MTQESGVALVAIRSFIIGQDEAIWVDILNRANAEYPDFTPETREGFELEKEGPWFDPEGMMIAELKGIPVGIAEAYIDKKVKEEHGSMIGPYVLPEYRRRGIGTTLALAVIDSLRARGKTKVRCWVREAPGPVAFIEHLGFNRIRIFSRMRHDLSAIPKDVGENRTVELVELEPCEDTIQLVTRLDNEAFAEHFNFRPVTLEETRHHYKVAKERNEWLFTLLAKKEGEPVGFLLGGSDPAEIKHRGRKVGWLYILGILKPFRNQGIGKALLIAGLEMLKAHGMTEAELNVDTDNTTGALRLYERLGFTVTRRYFTYEKPLT